MISDINGTERIEFSEGRMEDAYKAIIGLSPKGKHYINVSYSDGRVLSFLMEEHYTAEGSFALTRFHPTNPMAYKQLKFKTVVTLRKAVLKEGRGAVPVGVVINPNKDELEINRKV